MKLAFLLLLHLFSSTDADADATISQLQLHNEKMLSHLTQETTRTNNLLRSSLAESDYLDLDAAIRSRSSLQDADALDNELSEFMQQDETTDTPFGKIQTATLHILFAIAGGVMTISIVTLAVLLVKKNSQANANAALYLPSEREPLMRGESTLREDLKPESLAQDQNRWNKSLEQQRKMALQLKQQADLISARGYSSSEQTTDISESESDEISSEQQRTALLQASVILSETAVKLEKERERTLAASLAATELEQKNRALLLATEDERKQKDLLKSHAEQMKKHHTAELAKQKAAALAAVENHTTLMANAKEEQERVKAQQQKDKAVEAATEIEKERVREEEKKRTAEVASDLLKLAVQAAATRVLDSNKKEKLLLQQETETAAARVLEMEAVNKQLQMAAEVERKELLHETEQERVRVLKEKKELKIVAEKEKERLVQETQAAAARVLEMEAVNKQLQMAAEVERTQLLQETEKERVRVLTEKKELKIVAEKEKEKLIKDAATAAALVLEQQISMHTQYKQSAEEEKATLLKTAEDDRVRLTEQYEHAVAHQQATAVALEKERENHAAAESNQMFFVADETAKLKAEHAAHLLEQKQEAAVALEARKQIIAHLQASDEEKEKLLSKAYEEKKMLIKTAEEDKARLFKDAEEGMAKFVEQTKEEKTRVQASHDALLKKEQLVSAELVSSHSILTHSYRNELNAAAAAADIKNLQLRLQLEKAKEEEAQNKEDADATAGGFGAAGFGASPLLTPTRQKGGRMQETTSPNKKLPGSPQKLFILESETEAHLLKKRRPSFRGSLLTETKVIDTIGAILEKKARADTIRVSKLKARVSLTQSTRDFFIQMHGTIARDRRMAQFRHSVMKHKAGNIRIQWFATLIGWNEDNIFNMYTPFLPDAIHVFIDFLMAIFSLDLIEEHLDQDPCLISVNELLPALGHGSKLHDLDWVPTAAATLSTGMFDADHRKTDSFNALLVLLRSKSVLRSEDSRNLIKETPDRFLELSFVMDAVLREWYVWKVPQDFKSDDQKSSLLLLH